MSARNSGHHPFNMCAPVVLAFCSDEIPSNEATTPGAPAAAPVIGGEFTGEPFS